MGIFSFITRTKNKDQTKEGIKYKPKEESKVSKENKIEDKSLREYPLHTNRQDSGGLFQPISAEIAEQRVLYYLGEDYKFLSFTNYTQGAKVKCKCGNEYYTGISETTYRECTKCNVSRYKIKHLEVKDEDMVKLLDKDIYTLIGIGNKNGSRFKNRLEVKHNYCLQEGTIAYHKIRDGVRCRDCIRIKKEREGRVKSNSKTKKANTKKTSTRNKTKPKLTHNNPTQYMGVKYSSSIGEREVMEVLNEKGVSYKREYRFPKLLNRRFDFYLKEYNLCIEFDGQQHYEPVEYFGGIDTFINTVNSDREKDKFCFDNNIRLLRIPYFSDVEEEINKAIKE